MKALIRGVELVVIALMAVISAVVFGEVVARGLLARSLIVTDELSRYLMIWVVMLGGVLLVRENGHIRVDFVLTTLPEPLRYAVLMVSDILSLVFLLALAGAAFFTTIEMRTQHTITLGAPMAIFYAALPIGAVLMAILVVHDFVGRIQAWRRTTRDSMTAR